MILTALFKIIELLTVKANNRSTGPRPTGGSNKESKSHENLPTHPTGARNSDGTDNGGTGIRNRQHLYSRSDRRHDRFIYRRLFLSLDDG